MALPEKPPRPLDSDCCGMGCSPCVFDIYNEEVAIWEEECKSLPKDATMTMTTDQEKHCEKYPILCKTEYHKFTIGEIMKETSNTNRYRFLLNSHQKLGIKTGQHVIVRGVLNGHYITRQYTPVSDVACEGHFDLMIKLYESGRMSDIIRSWQVGSAVEIRGPFGSFSCKPNQWRDMYMLAAGTGIAPILQVIRQVLANEEDETRLHLIYCCKLYADILMKTEIDSWAQFWNFSVLFALSQEHADCPSAVYRYGEKIHFGRVTSDLLSEQITPKGSFLIFLCGPKSFEYDILHYTSQNNIPETQTVRF